MSFNARRWAIAATLHVFAAAVLWKMVRPKTEKEQNDVGND